MENNTITKETVNEEIKEEGSRTLNEENVDETPATEAEELATPEEPIDVAVEEDVKSTEEVKEGADFIPEEPADEMSEADKKQAAENEKFLTDARDIADKIFDEILITSDKAYASIELIPEMLRSKLTILRGRSKLWAEVNKATDKFYTTPVNELELYETVEESKE